MKKIALLTLFILTATYGAGTENSDAAFNELECATGGDCKELPLTDKMTREERNRARRAAEAEGKDIKNRPTAKKTESITSSHQKTQAPKTTQSKEPNVQSSFTPKRAKRSLYKYIGLAQTEGSFTETVIASGASRTLDYKANKFLLGLFLPTVNMKLELGLTSVTLSDTFGNSAPAVEVDYDLLLGSGDTSGLFDAFYYLRLGLAANSIEYTNYTTSGYGWRFGVGVDIVLFETLDFFIDYTYMSLKSMPENYQDPTSEEGYSMTSAGLNYLF